MPYRDSSSERARANTVSRMQRWRERDSERYLETERRFRDLKQLAITEEKLRRGKCANEECGLVVTPDNTVVFDFDHRDRSSKRGNVSKMKLRSLAEEMAKCDLLCANCHRLRTKQQRKEGGRAFFRSTPLLVEPRPTYMDPLF